MGLVGTAPLVAAVSNAGGLGLLGAGEIMKEMMEEAQAVQSYALALNTL